ncbi:hypothetical protein JW911_04335 [Candidatus Peregrinibacteria bacterium]|nr:hypothetical protein [Candidatus Peregrinibacteria bacterium]
MKLKNNHFACLIFYGLLGAVIGLVAGFLLGWMMYGAGRLFYSQQIMEGLYYTFPLMGMACGTLVGAIMGSLTAIRRVK